MAQFEYTLPGKIIFGAGARKRLTDFLPPGPVLIVSGRHAQNRIREELLPLLSGRECELVSDISPELPLADAARCVDAARRIKAAAIVGYGGGSAIDAAKSAAIMQNSTGTVEEVFYGRAALLPRRNFFAALPTTAGTGAEITSNAVLHDPATMVKQSIRHATMAADLAIVDPELTCDCPAAVTAASGFDAFTQAIESFISNRAGNFSRALARQAAAQIAGALLPACRHGDRQARELLAEGSMLAAMAFAQSGLGAVHGIGHPLGSALNIPHGVCCAILLPEVLKFNAACCGDRLSELAGAVLGRDAGADELISAVAGLRRELGLPENLRAWRPDSGQLEFAVRHCRSGSMKSNPRQFSDDEVRALLERLSR